MKFGRFIGAMLLLNLAMVVYLVIVITRADSRFSGTYADVEPTTAVESVTNILWLTNVVTVPATNQFRWSQLESEDYRNYIENLRAVGCPEQTIRDIIISDLDLLWSHRLLSIYPRREDLQYWHSEEYELRNNFDQRDFLRQEREVDREKREVIRELVGTDLVAERMKLAGRQDEVESRLSFLGLEKRMDVREAWESLQDKEWEIQQKIFDEGASLTDEERDELKALRAQHEEKLMALLTPEEKKQFDLWMSPVAEDLRHDLYGMNATEEEFLDLYTLRREFEDQWNPDYVDFSNPQEAASWSAAQSELESQIKNSLGEERYEEYLRGQNEDFHLLNATASRYGLSPHKANQVYDFKRSLEMEKEEVFNNINLSPAQREEILAAMEQTTAEEIRRILGENAFNYYRRRSSWMR